MTVLVDTSVWSLAYRRHRWTAAEQEVVDELKRCIQSHQAAMMGPIRQEVLSGIGNLDRWRILRTTLRAFNDLPLVVEDFENAARFYNQCRAAGIQGSKTDFLVCAVATRHDAPIFTTDGDFALYAKHIDITLHRPGKPS